MAGGNRKAEGKPSAAAFRDNEIIMRMIYEDMRKIIFAPAKIAGVLTDGELIEFSLTAPKDFDQRKLARLKSRAELIIRRKMDFGLPPASWAEVFYMIDQIYRHAPQSQRGLEYCKAEADRLKEAFLNTHAGQQEKAA